MSEVLGVLVFARNGDRTEYYQDPVTYEGSLTQTTALGEAQSHQLGTFLRATYLNPASPSYISGMRSDLVDNNEIHVHVKGGGEGTVVFDSAIALLQGLFPPNPNNKIELANETTVMAPLGGYQYVPVETIEPGNDRSLESWTDCPAFTRHVTDFYASESFKNAEKAAAPFFSTVKDYVFGRPTTLENAWNIYDYMHTQLLHNKTYAYRLPPTLIEQARGFANFHENGVFSDAESGGIGDIAGRTLLASVLSSLERIAFNGDPLQFFLIETSYQPFISFFHMTEMAKEYPELAAIPNYASALAIELRRGPPPEDRAFLRIKFKNGTNENFETYHVFGHQSDIALTEFIYRIENYAITSNKQWQAACNSDLTFSGFPAEQGTSTPQNFLAGILAFVFLLVLLFASKFVKRSRAKAQAGIRLADDENTAGVVTSEREKARIVL